MPNNNEQISFNVTKPLWTLNRAVNGWQKEVNMVAWNGKKPKLDVREWNADKTKMRRGVTLSRDEALELKRCMSKIDIDWLYDVNNNTGTVQTGPGPAASFMQEHPETESVKGENDEEEAISFPDEDGEAECTACNTEPEK